MASSIKDEASASVFEFILHTHEPIYLEWCVNVWQGLGSTLDSAFQSGLKSSGAQL